MALKRVAKRLGSSMPAQAAGKIAQGLCDTRGESWAISKPGRQLRIKLMQKFLRD